MDDQEKMLNKMREIALQNPENIKIIETNIDSEVQIEFFEILQEIGKLSKLPEPEELKENLYSSDKTITEKKEIIAILTSYGEVETYRIIEDYLKNPEKELKNWAYLAVQQARLFLESKLLEESKIYIASGLGGKEHRLRYIFAFSTIEAIITDSQKKLITGEIEYFLKKNDGFVENIIFSENYIICTTLIAIYVNLVELIQEIVTEINQYGSFLNENVYITNEKPISIEDLKKVF